MIVSWDWLKDYLKLEMTHDELVARLTMSGLNHESTHRVDHDRAIDLEVTSNRSDCLGHLGVAREISVLFDLPLTIPDPQPKATGPKVESLIDVTIEAPELCSRFTARVIKGIKLAPSPDWIADRLETLGCNLVNNVVDITNYVMFECGQPLHAFDYQAIRGKKIIVRSAKDKEAFLAINHAKYELAKGMCVIADAERAIGIGGVMGGVDSEVSESTTDLLIEAAAFNSMAIRSTSRALGLPSEAQYRFERPIDPERVDWASRRACELILEYAGGELAEGMIDAGAKPAPRESFTLRLDQIPRVLGIDVPQAEVEQILSKLGNKIESKTDQAITVTPPTWRSDLTREVDLIEEVARIHGYEQIPEDVPVPMTATIRSDYERVVDRVRKFLNSVGFDEAVTPSLTIQKWSDLFSPWTDRDPIVSMQPMLGVSGRAWQNEGQVNVCRRSLIPSLLEVRRFNEHHANFDAELFEIAKVYLAEPSGLPQEPEKITLVSGRSFLEVKGIVESLVQYINPEATIQAELNEGNGLAPNASAQLKLEGNLLAFIGEIDEAVMKAFKLSKAVTVAELDLSVLASQAVIVPQLQPVIAYPPVSRDFNFVVDESVRWAELSETIQKAGGPLLESIDYRETFRNADKDGAGKKRLMLSVTLRSAEGTLTGDQAEQVCQSIVKACSDDHQAHLLA